MILTGPPPKFHGARDILTFPCARCYDNLTGCVGVSRHNRTSGGRLGNHHRCTRTGGPEPAA